MTKHKRACWKAGFFDGRRRENTCCEGRLAIMNYFYFYCASWMIYEKEINYFYLSSVLQNKKTVRNIIKIFALSLLLFTAEGISAQNHAFQSDIDIFKQQDKTTPVKEHSILFIGSSSFTKWTSVQQDFPGYPIINRGFGGSTIKDLIYFADDIIYPYHPKQIVIYCGENDLTEPNLNAGIVFDRFRILFNLIRKHYPDIPVVFISLKPSPSRVRFREAMEASNAMIKYYLSGQKNTTFVDVYHSMLDAGGNAIEDIFLPDKLHMNAKGYAIWIKALRPYLIK